ncbi:uncharacterized protein BXZ73DRAFT_100050 [Epithele typhae]|uniref:uncharacterized protein n=1 Tax=Epithele typhae TaxID=378194 RepID=UPI0020086ED8|nr:uncharacterized protein BXZ73DRAFT_100050 [Epithele typhae]KAH9937836.1 hypothetical protein BXZ73DRAFT_100050 [Epithele typhae]
MARDKLPLFLPSSPSPPAPDAPDAAAPSREGTEEAEEVPAPIKKEPSFTGPAGPNAPRTAGGAATLSRSRSENRIVQRQDSIQEEASPTPTPPPLLASRKRRRVGTGAGDDEGAAPADDAAAGSAVFGEAGRLVDRMFARIAEMEARLEAVEGRLRESREEVKALKEEAESRAEQDKRLSAELTKLEEQQETKASKALVISLLNGQQEANRRELEAQRRRDLPVWIFVFQVSLQSTASFVSEDHETICL